MIIYHGSKAIIEHPLPKGSDPHNDYGPSFYMTLDLDAAKAWACKNDELGVVNKYSVRNDAFEKLKILDLRKKGSYSILNWVAILMHFRQLDAAFRRQNEEALNWLASYYIDVDLYDVVIGFRADDSYFRFPREFLSGNLAFEDLNEVYLLGNLGIQYAFMSKRALRLLKFQAALPCEDSFLGKHYQTVKEASLRFTEILEKPKTAGKTYILDLIRRSHG